MARARKKAAKPAGGRTATRTQSKKKPVAEVEVVEERPGLGFEDGIVIVTTVVLLTAMLLVDFHLGSYYDKGFLF